MSVRSGRGSTRATESSRKRDERENSKVARPFAPSEHERFSAFGNHTNSTPRVHVATLGCHPMGFADETDVRRDTWSSQRHARASPTAAREALLSRRASPRLASASRPLSASARPLFCPIRRPSPNGGERCTTARSNVPTRTSGSSECLRPKLIKRRERLARGTVVARRSPVRRPPPAAASPPS